jgi:hypothetical protein
MGLDQYLQADYYFSDTWDNNNGKAAEIARICDLPSGLVRSKQVSVRITLMHWRNTQWLHDYIIEHAQADCDASECYVDTKVLEDFIVDATRVIDGEDPIDCMFPNPDWSDLLKHYDRKHTDYDRLVLVETRDKFIEIINTLPCVDFYYRSSC